MDQQGKPIRIPAQAEAFAASPLATTTQTRPANQNEVIKQALIAKIKMVENFSTRQADKYQATVTRFASNSRSPPGVRKWQVITLQGRKVRRQEGDPTWTGGS